MLTNNDLKQIKKIIDPLAEDLNSVKNDLNGVKKDLSELKVDLKDVKKRVRKTERTVSLIAKNYDEGDVLLARRVTKLEQHVGLPTQN